MTDQAAVLCRDLCFSYMNSTIQILKGVNADVGTSEYVAIAGPSGAGKSTFCRTLNNIIPLYFKGNLTGTRQVAGEWLEKQRISYLASKVGIVFQDFEQQLFSTNALLELSFGLENFGVLESEMARRIQDLIGRFDLGRLIRREPFSLSGGEKQKLAIASVLAYKPQILVLDEPTTDLDPESRELVLQILPELKEWVETLIIVDHEVDQFVSADKVFLFDDGVIQSAGESRQILGNSALLERHALSPLDLIRIQERLEISEPDFTVSGVLQKLDGSKLQRIETPGRTASAPVIEIRRLSFTYKDQEVGALKDVSFDIREGEFVGIIGRNGSGKSTLLRHLNGLQNPQIGTIKILGKEVQRWNRKELARSVGLVFQNPDHQIFETTVKNEVEFGPRQFGLSGDQLKANVQKAIETMDLQSTLDSDPFQLSKGERQRVAVASILSLQPKILILDEPTTGLDHRHQSFLMDMLRELNRTGITIIIVTHAIRLVGQYCNYAILLHRGEKIAEGHPRDLLFENMNMKLPPLLELSEKMGGNALTVNEFVKNVEMKK